MKIQKYPQQLLGCALLGFLLWAPFAYGIDLTSTSFIVRDPIVGTGGGYSTSASFGSYISGDMATIGKSASASFEGREGFLWYPYVTQGIFTATANGSQADLSWGASGSGLGWDIGGYSVGMSSVHGGPYTYMSVGNVTSYSYTGLASGLYCFVLRTLDVFSNTIATSAEQCISIEPSLSFSNDDATIGFGTLSASATRYADGSGSGASSDTTAHTIAISTNAANGYTLSYKALRLTSGANTINAVSNIATGGTPGVSQFALSGVLTGTGTMSSGYNHTNWSSVDTATTPLASSSTPVVNDSIALHYQTNISSSTPAGLYGTVVTYILAGNF